jgi:hypothetical protein
LTRKTRPITSPAKKRQREQGEDQRFASEESFGGRSSEGGFPGGAATDGQACAGQAPNGKPKRNENRAEQAERRLHGGHSKDHGDAEKDAGNQVAAIAEEIDFVFGKLEPGFQSSDASLDDSVIFVVQPELIAAIEEDGADLFFVGSEHADVGFAAIEGVRASLFLDAEVATDSHVQNGGRKSFIVKTHADEEACAA